MQVVKYYKLISTTHTHNTISTMTIPAIVQTYRTLRSYPEINPKQKQLSVLKGTIGASNKSLAVHSRRSWWVFFLWYGVKAHLVQIKAPPKRPWCGFVCGVKGKQTRGTGAKLNA